MSLINLEDINNLLWDKALKSRGDDTIMYINIKDDINSLPQYNPEDGWIPVTERLPTEYGRYMTYAPMLEPQYIIYFDGNEWIAKFPEKITHWMPLPLPPKQ